MPRNFKLEIKPLTYPDSREYARTEVTVTQVDPETKQDGPGTIFHFTDRGSFISYPHTTMEFDEKDLKFFRKAIGFMLGET